MELVKINFEEIRNRLSAVLSNFPEVAGAYLFGSALELCRTDSDIDLGIFVTPELDERQRFMLEGQIALKIEPLSNHFFDLTIVDPENILFAFRILHEGTLVYLGNQITLSDLIEQISRKYDEVGLRYRQAMAEIIGEGYSREIGLSTDHSEDRLH